MLKHLLWLRKGILEKTKALWYLLFKKKNSYPIPVCRCLSLHSPVILTSSMVTWGSQRIKCLTVYKMCIYNSLKRMKFYCLVKNLFMFIPSWFVWLDIIVQKCLFRIVAQRHIWENSFFQSNGGVHLKGKYCMLHLKCTNVPCIA